MRRRRRRRLSRYDMSDEPIIVMFPGKGPAIRGTRITVYDVMDYYKSGTHRSIIAYTLRVKPEEVDAAIEYIESHREHVMREYQKMLDRDAAGNPPEIRAKLEESHRRLEEFMKNREAAKKAEAAGAG